MADILDKVSAFNCESIYTLEVNPTKLNACIDDILSRLDKLEGANVAPTETSTTWISVYDRLPEPSEHVLIYCNDGLILVGWYDYYRMTFLCTDGTPCVTHWMPLPAPPEEESV